MIGLVFKDSGIDKLITLVNSHYGSSLPVDIHYGDDVLDMSTDDGILFFKNQYFTTRPYTAFRLVNVSIVQDDNFDIHEIATHASTEKIAYVSNDNANIVAYRSGSYQVVTVASLLTSELIDIGELTFTDMQSVMSAAATLTSPQVRYITPVGNDTVTLTEL